MEKTGVCELTISQIIKSFYEFPLISNSKNAVPNVRLLSTVFSLFYSLKIIYHTHFAMWFYSSAVLLWMLLYTTRSRVCVLNATRILVELIVRFCSGEKCACAICVALDRYRDINRS